MEIGRKATADRTADGSGAAAESLVWPRRISVGWLIVWSGTALWACYGLATAWPYELHPLLVVLAVAVPGVVFRTADLLFLQCRKRRLAGWRRVGGRLVALVPGIALAFALFSLMEPMSMAGFDRGMSSFVSHLQARVPVPCPADGHYPVDAALNAYLERSGGLRKGTLHQGSGRFVLELAGRSIDIDGSTVYYDSATRRWHRFHNDNRERSREFESLVEPLAPCRFTLS